MADTQGMEAHAASYRVVAASLVVLLGAFALFATYINGAVALVLIEETGRQLGWLGVVYLIVALAVPASAAYRGNRTGKPRADVARQAVFGSLAVNLLMTPLTVTALSM